MANAIKWSSTSSSADLIATGLDTLTAGSKSTAASCTAFDNVTNKAQVGKVDIAVTFGSAPAAGGYVAVYMITAPDGTNYDQTITSNDPGSHKLIATIPVAASTSAQVLSTGPFQLEPFNTKFIVHNGTSVSTPGSGTTLNLRYWNDEVQ